MNFGLNKHWIKKLTITTGLVNANIRQTCF